MRGTSPRIAGISLVHEFGQRKRSELPPLQAQHSPEHIWPLKRTQEKSSHSQYLPVTFPKSLLWQTHCPQVHSPRWLQRGWPGRGLQLSCCEGLYSSSEHSQCEPRRPGLQRHTPHSSVPLPRLQDELLASAWLSQEQLQLKFTTTVRLSLKPTGLMVKDFCRSRGHPRTLASMLKLTWRAEGCVWVSAPLAQDRGYLLQDGLSSSPMPKLKRPRNGTHQVSLGFSKLSQHSLG